MRILKLELLAFGPFANQTLDLSDGRFGLHLVYGPNEAGKSSTLRALRQVLYGIERQTTDDFRFPYKKLKLGATLEHSEGEVLSFIRLKKDKNPLRSANEEETLDDNCLDRFLGNVDQGMFIRQFGLNWENLVAGGQEMVRSDGELSRILFAAGSGLTALTTVQDAIEKEMRELFLPTGTNPIINNLLMQHGEVEDQLRQVRLTSQEWRRHAEAVEAARKKQTELNKQRNDLKRERNRLQRIHHAKRPIQKLRETERELCELQHAKILPAGFAERRLKVRDQLLQAEQAQATLQSDLKRQAKQRATIAVNQALLDQAEEIESLNQEIEKYKSSVQDHPQINSLREAAENEARRLLKELHPNHPWEKVDDLRLAEADRALIRELGPDQKVLAARVETARQRAQETQQRLDELVERQKHFVDVPDLSVLKSALKRATAKGQLEADRDERQKGIALAEQNARSDCERLPFWRGTLEELEALRVPMRETVNQFQANFEEIQRKLHDAIQQRENDAESLRANALELDRLESDGEVPTEEDLNHSRRLRDEGWRLGQLCWLKGEESPQGLSEFLDETGSPTLEAGFQKAMEQADYFADQIRRETSRVNDKKRLLANRKQLESNLPERENRIAACQRELERVDGEWKALWKPLGIEPGTPGEMLEWLQRHRELMTPVKGLPSQRQYVQLLNDSIEDLREQLIAALEAVCSAKGLAKKPLWELIEQSQAVLDDLTDRQNQRARLEEEIQNARKNLPKCEQEIRSAENALQEWQNKWAGLMEKLGLTAEATPTQANAILDTLDRLFEKLREESNAAIRVRAMRDFNTQFEARVEALVRSLDWESDGLLPIQIVNSLHNELTRTREAAHKLRDVQEELERQGQALKAEERTIQQSQAELQQMCAEAGCEHPDELPRAEKDSDRRQELLKDRNELREQILQFAAEASFEEFLKEADTEDTDALSGTLADLEKQIEDAENELTVQIQLTEREQSILNQKCGGSQAAQAAEDKQALLADIRLHLERYVQLRLASEALKEGVERYRAKHQGPVLKRASELFRQLTCGAYLRLQNDGDDQGKPRLVGIRLHEGSEEPVEVSGMSDGTADQLYLALRIASLEDWLNHHSPMPFIVDDILINFDDQRAVAALQVLAELSKRTQVIFFTHHQHLLELAEMHLSKGRCFYHFLGKEPTKRRKKSASSKEGERATLF